MAVNLHLWAKIEHVRKTTRVPLIVIDPRRRKTTECADWHISIRIDRRRPCALRGATYQSTFLDVTIWDAAPA